MIHQPLVDALKKSLKAKKITYAKLAKMLDISDNSVRRIFSEGTFTLERFVTICDLVGITFEELALMRDLKRQKIWYELDRKEEEFFVANITYLVFLELILEGRSPNEIAKDFELSQASLTKMLSTLEKMRFIEWLPGNEAKVLIPMRLKMIENGPLIRAYETESITDFVNSSFAGEDEFKVFRLAHLSEASIKKLFQRWDDLRLEVGREVDLENKLNLSTKHVGILMALRPWQDPFYEKLRKFEA